MEVVGSNPITIAIEQGHVGKLLLKSLFRGNCYNKCTALVSPTMVIKLFDNPNPKGWRHEVRPYAVGAIVRNCFGLIFQQKLPLLLSRMFGDVTQLIA